VSDEEYAAKKKEIVGAFWSSLIDGSSAQRNMQPREIHVQVTCDLLSSLCEVSILSSEKRALQIIFSSADMVSCLFLLCVNFFYMSRVFHQCVRQLAYVHVTRFCCLPFLLLTVLCNYMVGDERCSICQQLGRAKHQRSWGNRIGSKCSVGAGVKSGSGEEGGTEEEQTPN